MGYAFGNWIQDNDNDCFWMMNTSNEPTSDDEQSQKRPVILIQFNCRLISPADMDVILHTVLIDT